MSAYLQESLVQSERENNSYREEIATLQALLVEASQGSVQVQLFIGTVHKNTMKTLIQEVVLKIFFFLWAFYTYANLDLPGEDGNTGFKSVSLKALSNHV